jgi:methionyl-tRNA synthetase
MNFESINWAAWSGIVALIVALAISDMVWKGIGLWKAGRNAQLGWFVCIFIFNTVGILPIVYVKFFQKKRLIEKVKEIL